jgi:6,7-dimethyl-8-ribityllumazine synthase
MQMKIGVVTSRFNSEVTEKLEKGALDYLTSLDQEIEILSVRVPGAVEIPLACQALLDKGCAGVVALGSVIRGDTSHYDYVCNSVERGITALMLERKSPIGFGVLTTENEEQALARAGGSHGNKGAECAEVVMEMIGLLKSLQSTDRASRQKSSGARTQKSGSTRTQKRAKVKKANKKQ